MSFAMSHWGASKFRNAPWGKAKQGWSNKAPKTKEPWTPCPGQCGAWMFDWKINQRAAAGSLAPCFRCGAQWQGAGVAGNVGSCQPCGPAAVNLGMVAAAQNLRSHLGQLSPADDLAFQAFVGRIWAREQAAAQPVAEEPVPSSTKARLHAAREASKKALNKEKQLEQQITQGEDSLTMAKMEVKMQEDKSSVAIRARRGQDGS